MHVANEQPGILRCKAQDARNTKAAKLTPEKHGAPCAGEGAGGPARPSVAQLSAAWARPALRTPAARPAGTGLGRKRPGRARARSPTLGDVRDETRRNAVHTGKGG